MFYPESRYRYNENYVVQSHLYKNELASDHLQAHPKRNKEMIRKTKDNIGIKVPIDLDSKTNKFVEDNFNNRNLETIARKNVRVSSENVNYKKKIISEEETEKQGRVSSQKVCKKSAKVESSVFQENEKRNSLIELRKPGFVYVSVNESFNKKNKVIIEDFNKIKKEQLNPIMERKNELEFSNNSETKNSEELFSFFGQKKVSSMRSGSRFRKNVVLEAHECSKQRNTPPQTNFSFGNIDQIGDRKINLLNPKQQLIILNENQNFDKKENEIKNKINSKQKIDVYDENQTQCMSKMQFITTTKNQNEKAHKWSSSVENENECDFGNDKNSMKIIKERKLKRNEDWNDHSTTKMSRNQIENENRNESSSDQDEDMQKLSYNQEKSNKSIGEQYFIKTEKQSWKSILQNRKTLDKKNQNSNQIEENIQEFSKKDTESEKEFYNKNSNRAFDDSESRRTHSFNALHAGHISNQSQQFFKKLTIHSTGMTSVNISNELNDNLEVIEEFITKNKLPAYVDKVLLSQEDEEFLIKFDVTFLDSANFNKLNYPKQRNSTFFKFKLIPLHEFKKSDADLILKKRFFNRKNIKVRKHI